MTIHVEIAAETLFKIGPIAVTNSMLTMFIVMGLIILGFWLVARNLKDVPGRWQGLLEMIVGFIMGIVEGTAGRKVSRALMPLVGGIFIFILFANYSGLLPGVGTIGKWKETTTVVASEGSAPQEVEHEKELVPFLRAPNADINMTLAMALVTFTTVQVYGIRANGVRGRIKHMADPVFLFPIEVVGEFARIVSLSARLFGNIFAGEVLMAVMVAMANAIKIAIIPLALPVVFLFLEVLFGSIQALVFALLTAIYITLATAGGHDDHESEHEVEHAPSPTPALAGSHGD
jgi:F-type H+-transporting ATPase subunit a